MNSYSLTHLSDAALVPGLIASHGDENEKIALTLLHIAEIDARKLYLQAAHPSMQSLLVHALRYTRQKACNRIRAARTAREFPVLFAALADGRLNLSALLLLAPHLTPANVAELLTAAAGRSNDEVESLLAERFPSSELLPWVAGSGSPAAASANATSEEVSVRTPPSDAFVQTASQPNRVRPLSADTVALHASITRGAHDLLRYGQALAGLAESDLPKALEQALQAWVAGLEKRRFGVGRRSRRGGRRSANPRHVPRAVKAAVWKRDGGRCTFVGDHGQRCPARERLHFDHVVPVGRGGESDVANLRLLCAAHNQYEAGRVYGEAFMNGKRESARESRRRAEAWIPVLPEPHGPAAGDDPGLGTTDEPDPEVVEDAIAALRSLGYRERDARETLHRCALPPGSTVEQHVRAALARRVRPLIVQSERIARLTA